MNAHRLTGPLVLFLTVHLMMLLGGCAAPDRWPVFKDIYHQEISGDEVAPVEPLESMDEFHPKPAESPMFLLPADGPVDVSIEQVTMLALQNNRDLHVRKINPIITGTFEQIERGVYDPELFVELEHAREQATEVSRSTESQFSVEGRDSAAVAGVRQELPTGTTVEATIGQNRSISSRSPEQQTARLGLSITQSLLQGFGPAVNLVKVQQAELDTVASMYELRGFTEALLAEAETAYWNFVLAKKEIEIFESSLAVARQQRDEVELRIEVGILPEIEAAAARAEVSRREQALINARSQMEERRLRLLRLISPEPDGRLDRPVNAVSEPAINPEPITDLSDRLLLAERARPDLNEARLRLDQNRLETITTRNGVLPRLDLFIAMGQTGYADTFSESFRELKGNTYDFSVGVRLSHYLGNRAAEARDRAARASWTQAVNAVENLRQMVRLDVRLAVNEAERSRQQISASKATRILQEETLKAEKERFDVGASTTLLVAQAQRDLLVSRIAEVEAIVNYRIALIGLYRAEGSLLERRGVSLADSFKP